MHKSDSGYYGPRVGNAQKLGSICYKLEEIKPEVILDLFSSKAGLCIEMAV
jgi:hypothetical protein